MYDTSQTEREVFSNIVGGVNKVTSLKDYLENILKSLSKIKNNKEAVFLHNLKTHMPPRVYEKVTEYYDRYEQIKNSPPTIEQIVSILYSNREQIDKYLSSSKNKFNEVKGTNENLEIEKFCNECKKSGHNSQQCYKKQTCNLCNEIGHTSRVCRTKNSVVSVKCGKYGRITSECISRGRLCNGLHNAVACPVYLTIEPSQSACNRCYE